MRGFRRRVDGEEFAADILLCVGKECAGRQRRTHLVLGARGLEGSGGGLRLNAVRWKREQRKSTTNAPDVMSVGLEGGGGGKGSGLRDAGTLT